MNINNPPQQNRTIRERHVLNAFDEVFAADEPLPPELIRRAQELYIWRDIDAELLDLLVDSARDELALVRDDSLQRFMAFGTADRGVQFECRSARQGFDIEGTILPHARYRVRILCPAGEVDVESDMFGSFVIHGIVGGSTRLTIQSEDGEVFMMTPWFVLEL